MVTPQTNTGTESGTLFLHPDRNLAMELVRATEAAAIRAVPFIGKGDKNGADGAAVDAMRKFLGTVNFAGTVVIGEGEKDKAPMLFNGEVVGNGRGLGGTHELHAEVAVGVQEEAAGVGGYHDRPSVAATWWGFE